MTTATDAEGKFVLSVDSDAIREVRSQVRLVRVRDDNGRLGAIQRMADEPWPPQPVRITLKPPRKLTVEVRDVNENPVQGAAAIAHAYPWIAVAEGTTDATGRWTADVPIDVRCDYVAALKPGAGFEYSIGQPDPMANAYRVKLKFAGARSVQLRVVDSRNQPVSNEFVYLQFLRTRANRSRIDPIGWMQARARTDGKGFAHFDWLPKNTTTTYIGFSIGKTETHEGATTSIPPTVTEAEFKVPVVGRVVLTGRLFLPDGRPAGGVEVHCRGDAQVRRVTTEPDGSYEFEGEPLNSYIIAIDDDNWAAHETKVIHGQDGTSVDITLSPGKIIRGRLTVGPDHVPEPGYQVTLSIPGIRSRPIPNASGANPPLEILLRATTTNDDGRFEFFVPPGEYQLELRPPFGPLPVTTGDQSELVQDIHVRRLPATSRSKHLTGRIVDDRDQPIPRPTLEYICDDPQFNLSRTRLPRKDRRGLFTFDQALVPLVLYARSRDGRLAGLLRVERDDKPVVIHVAPTARAHGRLVNANDQAIDRATMEYGIVLDRSAPIEESSEMAAFVKSTTTDHNGEFNLVTLVPGRDYIVRYVTSGRDRRLMPVTKFSSKDATDVDLGDLRLGRKNGSERL